MTEPTTWPQGDLCLKFPDRETAEEALQDYEGAVDVIGVIYKPTGDTIDTPDGPIPVTTPLPGWHVNTRGPIKPELQAWAVQPKQPTRVWA